MELSEAPVMEKVKHGFKKTEVGVIPEDWDVVPLGTLGSFTKGAGIRKDQVQGTGLPCIRYGEIYTAHNDVIRQFRSFISKEVAIAGKRLKNGDLLFAGSGETKEEIGKCVVFIGTNEVYAGGDIVILSLAKGDPLFFGYLMNAPVIVRQKASRGQGDAVVHIGSKALGDVLVPLPSTETEQRAIAKALSDVDALLGSLDVLIAKKKAIKQGAMQQLLTGNQRLPGFGPTKAVRRAPYCIVPADWEIKPFNEVSSMNGRIGWQGLKFDEFTVAKDDPYLITGMNFKDGKIRWEEVYHITMNRYAEAPAIQLRTDDVLMTKDGTIGKLLYVDAIPHPGKASLNSHLLVMRPVNNQYDPKYLFYQLSTPAFAQHVELNKSGTTFYGLTQEAMGKYPTVLPSLPEQTAIATVVSDMDAEISALEARRAKTALLKQGMMQELLTGRTRLV